MDAVLLDVTWEEYRAREGISQTELNAFRNDPQVYEMVYVTGELPREKPTPDMLLGSAIDRLLLDGEESTPSVYPDECLNKNGGRISARCKAWEESHPEQTWLTPKEHQREIGAKLRAKRNVEEHDKARRILESATQRHVRLCWTDELTGLPLKCELDFAAPALLLGDLKVAAPTAMENPEAWARHLVGRGYDVQMAHYRQGWQALTGERLPWCWIAIRNNPAMSVEVYEPTEMFMEMADAKWRDLLFHFQETQRSGVWRRSSHGHVVQVDRPFRY